MGPIAWHQFPTRRVRRWCPHGHCHQHDLPQQVGAGSGFNTLVASAETANELYCHGDGAQQAMNCRTDRLSVRYHRHRDDLVALLNRLASCHHPMTDLVRVIATAALAHTESRGGHWRADYPHQIPPKPYGGPGVWSQHPNSRLPTHHHNLRDSIHADV